MARINNLTNFLNDVATAIKTKLGDSTSIPAAQFDSKIMDIHTGGTYQTKSITIQTNGNYTLNPDSGYDAMDQVTISVTVPQTGGDVKLFATEEVMNAYPNPQENDLGLVYRDVWVNVTVDSVFQIIKLPKTVVLSEQLSEDVWGDFEAMDGSWSRIMFSANSSSARISMELPSDMLEYSYSSTDGLTYVLQNYDADQIIEFEMEMGCRYPEYFSSVSGEFIKISSAYLGGLYTYSAKKDEDYTTAATNLVTDTTSVTYDTISVETKQIVDMCRDVILDDYNLDYMQRCICNQ